MNFSKKLYRGSFAKQPVLSISFVFFYIFFETNYSRLWHIKNCFDIYLMLPQQMLITNDDNHESFLLCSEIIFAIPNLDVIQEIFIFKNLRVVAKFWP